MAWTTRCWVKRAPAPLDTHVIERAGGGGVELRGIGLLCLLQQRVDLGHLQATKHSTARQAPTQQVLPHKTEQSTKHTDDGLSRLRSSLSLEETQVGWVIRYTTYIIDPVQGHSGSVCHQATQDSCLGPVLGLG